MRIRYLLIKLRGRGTPKVDRKVWFHKVFERKKQEEEIAQSLCYNNFQIFPLTDEMIQSIKTLTPALGMQAYYYVLDSFLSFPGVFLFFLGES